jgi:hypothetical protein
VAPSNIDDDFFSDITLVGDRSVDEDKDPAFAMLDVEKSLAVVVGKLAAGAFQFGAAQRDYFARGRIIR